MPTWNNLPVSFYGFDDVDAFFDGVRKRFLAVDMLAGGERRQRHVVVQVFGRHDEDGVDRLVLKIL